MNESTGKTASCLAITEKRVHRPGCVGIFFQLFDWNRRFAKKKLFSRKLLPPARAKQASKKFGGDEKMPKTKLHLIADENSGGFPNVKKNGMEQKHEMRAPSLVARLMGLECMPAIQRDNKPKKAASFSTSCDVKEEKIENNNNHSGSNNREDLNLEKGNTKLESRPQKIQKTGPFETQAVTRFGAEALQIKSVLSRSRKHNHHPKLAATVKSPRISSARSASTASRLIGAAATRILEPGLQARNRAKCALTYSSSMHYTSKDGLQTEEIGVMSPDLAKQSGYNVNSGKSTMEHTSCKSCGKLLDVADSRPNVEEQPFVYTPSASNLVNSSTQGVGKNKSRTPISFIQHESEVVFQRGPDQPVNLAPQEKDNMRSSRESIPDRKPLSRQVQVQWHSTSQQSKPQKDEPASIAFKHRTQTQNQMSLSRDRIPPRHKLSNLQSRRVSSAANAVSGAKDFVALNRSSSGCTRPRVRTKVDPSTFDSQKKSSNRQDDSLTQVRSPVRKRRTVSARSGKQMGPNFHPMDRTCIKNQSASQGEVNRANGNKDSDVISFTFNSPLRHKTGISSEMKAKIKDQSDFISNSTSDQRKLVLDEYDGQMSLQKQFTLRGDALGALLEQKLEELTSQEEDELTMGTTAPKRSSAMILQELITALTAEQPVSQDGHIFNRDIAFQNKAKTEGTSVGFLHNGDHLSPGSVLEASFSNDSFFSSSLDDSSGRRLHFNSMDYSYDQLQPTERDADLLDSATSLNQGRTGNKMVTDLVNQISRMLHSINNGGFGLTGSKLTYAKEVILNAELLFGNVSLHNSNGTKDLLIGPSVLEKLDTLAGAMLTNLNCLLGFEETKEGNHIRGFLFDCVIECLDSKYSQYCHSGFKAWRRLPLCMNAEMLIQEVGVELRRWTQLSGMVADEVIEWDWSHSLGKWMDFDIEAFETDTEIGQDILQELLLEVVIDILQVSGSAS